MGPGRNFRTLGRRSSDTESQEKLSPLELSTLTSRDVFLLSRRKTGDRFVTQGIRVSRSRYCPRGGVRLGGGPKEDRRPRHPRPLVLLHRLRDDKRDNIPSRQDDPRSLGVTNENREFHNLVQLRTNRSHSKTKKGPSNHVVRPL